MSVAILLSYVGFAQPSVGSGCTSVILISGVTSLDDAMSSCAGSMVGNVGMVVGKGIGEHDCADDWVKDEPCL